MAADGDCSHEIKRHLLLGRKVMNNLDSILKSRDITLPTKVRLVKAMVFPVVMYGSEKAMAIHSSTLAWKIPWTEGPGRLQSMGSQRVGHDWATDLIWSDLIVQLSHPYMTTGKTIALTRRTLLAKMSLIFNMLPRLVITFLPRSKHLSISRLQSPSAVILKPPKNKVCHYFHLFPIKWWDWMPWS